MGYWRQTLEGGKEPNPQFQQRNYFSVTEGGRDRWQKNRRQPIVSGSQVSYLRARIRERVRSQNIPRERRMGGPGGGAPDPDMKRRGQARSLFGRRRHGLKQDWEDPNPVRPQRRRGKSPRPRPGRCGPSLFYASASVKRTPFSKAAVRGAGPSPSQ